MKHILFFIVVWLSVGYLSTNAQSTSPAKQPTARPVGELDTYSPADVARLRKELADAWRQSEKYSLVIAEQMPAEHYFFRSTDSTMTFAEQWRHCMIYTCNQLSGRLDVENPYKGKKPPIQMPKEQILRELKTFYAHVQRSIETLPVPKLYEMTAFPDGSIPGWRLFYALENHIIHHRGQCIVYLRLKGIHPKGYFGW